MQRDRSQVFKGMRLEGAPGPTVPLRLKKDIREGDFIVADGGPVTFAKSSKSAPVRYDELRRRMDDLQKRIEAAAQASRPITSTSSADTAASYCHLRHDCHGWHRRRRRIASLRWHELRSWAGARRFQ